MKRLPLVGSMARHLYFRFIAAPIAGSGNYWETRYRSGGNSGTGSQSRLAEFKAGVLNDFVTRNKIVSVVEFGCGDGRQLELAEYSEYVGIDVSTTAIALCRSRFADDSTKQFLGMGEPLGRTFDLALSLDVIYHLVEDEVFQSYMTALFDASHRWIIIYSSNTYESVPEPHIRHRRFSDWVDQNRPEWKLVREIRNKYPFDQRDPDNTSFAGFYIYELCHPVVGS